VYSYLQYHWCPKTFKVRAEPYEESKLYKIVNEGIAIATRMAAGATVQTDSRSCPSNSPRWVNLAPLRATIKYPTAVITKISTSIK